MNQTEFKLKYPQYSHLGEDALWNMMEDTLLQSGNCLYADPEQIKTFCKQISSDILQNDGTYVKSYLTIEDSSTTRWLNSKGELVRVAEIERPTYKHSLTTYSLEIIDFSKL